METRRPLYPKFGISKQLEHFTPPPCQPPKGKEVLERFFDVLHGQGKNQRSAETAASEVAKELIQLWKLGDGRIPLNQVKTIAKRIFDFRSDLAWLCKTSMETRPIYKTKVNNDYSSY